MLLNENKIELLKKSNPFSSASSGDPWDSKYPHVESINRKTLKGIYNLIRQKNENPEISNFAAMVLGEVGSGKSHLITRILNFCNNFTSPFSFAYIQPIEDPSQTYRYLLREIIVCLCHKIDKSSEITYEQYFK